MRSGERSGIIAIPCKSNAILVVVIVEFCIQEPNTTGTFAFPLLFQKALYEAKFAVLPAFPQEQGCQNEA